MRTVMMSVVFLALVSPSMASGQPRPDFSGEWTLDRSASSLQGDMTAVEGGVLRIQHREPSFEF